MRTVNSPLSWGVQKYFKTQKCQINFTDTLTFSSGPKTKNIGLINSYKHPWPINIGQVPSVRNAKA